MQAAAKKYGFEYKRFAANFNPATQIKQVQNAITEGFDGYLFAPTAAAPGCTMWKRHLVPTGKPCDPLRRAPYRDETGCSK